MKRETQKRVLQCCDEETQLVVAGFEGGKWSGSKGILEALGSFKRQEYPKGTQPCQNLDFSLLRPILDFYPQELKIRDVCFLK